MSWIFALVLTIYALVWLSMWMRGRWRWWQSELRRRPTPQARTAPKQLDPSRRALFELAEAARVEATLRARVCERVMIMDPDVQLGGVRSGDFRRASIEGAQRSRARLQRLVELQERSPELFMGLPDFFTHLEAAQRTLESHAKRVRGTRALESFPLEFCRATQRAFEHIARNCEQLSRHLERQLQADPYRPGRAPLAR